MKFSLVIPVYRNEASIPRLLDTLATMHLQLGQALEVVFVIDGSPDRCFELLREAMPRFAFAAQLVAHSRNFGSFAAIRTGLAAARGDFFAVMAADLQEPPHLVVDFFNALNADTCDVVVGTRTSRDDPRLSRVGSRVFWFFYRRWVVPEMPPGGVDIFGCNRAFRDQLLKLEEARSSLIALIFWLGFRRQLIGYERQQRLEGTSAWTLSRKIDYLFDSVFAFTDVPIRWLIRIGAFGSIGALLAGVFVTMARLGGWIEVPGYAALMITTLLIGALNLLGLGVVGTYAWRGYENSKSRPLAVVARRLYNTD
jgi:polyisoprenyl-phosphate glycosyltransferase